MEEMKYLGAMINGDGSMHRWGRELRIGMAATVIEQLEAVCWEGGS